MMPRDLSPAPLGSLFRSPILTGLMRSGQPTPLDYSVSASVHPLESPPSIRRGVALVAVGLLVDDLHEIDRGHSPATGGECPNPCSGPALAPIPAQAPFRASAVVGDSSIAWTPPDAATTPVAALPGILGARGLPDPKQSRLGQLLSPNERHIMEEDDPKEPIPLKFEPRRVARSFIGGNQRLERLAVSLVVNASARAQVDDHLHFDCVIELIRHSSPPSLRLPVPDRSEESTALALAATPRRWTA